MDTTGINGTNLHEDKWYRSNLSNRRGRYHHLFDIGGEMQGLIIHTNCGLQIRANDCDGKLVDWTRHPPKDKTCKTCHKSRFLVSGEVKSCLNQNKKPKVIWGAAINLSGLWGPCKMKYHEECEQYYDHSGNLSVDCVGLNQRDGVTEFGSESKEEVKLWVSGVKATMKMMSRWCSNE